MVLDGFFSKSPCPSMSVRQISIKLHTVVLYDLRMCMKEDNPHFLREIIICAGQGNGILCDLTQSSSL